MCIDGLVNNRQLARHCQLHRTTRCRKRRTCNTAEPWHDRIPCDGTRSVKCRIIDFCQLRKVAREHERASVGVYRAACRAPEALSDCAKKGLDSDPVELRPSGGVDFESVCEVVERIGFDVLKLAQPLKLDVTCVRFGPLVVAVKLIRRNTRCVGAPAQRPVKLTGARHMQTFSAALARRSDVSCILVRRVGARRLALVFNRFASSRRGKCPGPLQ